MNVLYLIGGALLIALSAVDALWTTLWVDGRAGPMTRRHASWARWLLWHSSGSADHRRLSLTGPAVLVVSLVLWALVMWAGWALVFSADPGSLLHSRRNTPASWAERVYFTGYSMFTLGNGDFSPQGPWWQVATALTTLSGLILVTLAVTYLISMLQAVVHKRSFASQVLALGRTPEEFVLHSWDGSSFRALDLQIVSLTEQLNLISERHQAYPMLAHYHASQEMQSVALGVAVFDEALTLLALGVRPEARPGPAALHCARGSVQEFLATLGGAYIRTADEPPPAPGLNRLRLAGVPTEPDAEFTARLGEMERRRRLLRGYVETERRDWPRTGGAAEDGAPTGG